MCSLLSENSAPVEWVECTGCKYDRWDATEVDKALDTTSIIGWDESVAGRRSIPSTIAESGYAWGDYPAPGTFNATNACTRHTFKKGERAIMGALLTRIPDLPAAWIRRKNFKPTLPTTMCVSRSVFAGSCASCVFALLARCPCRAYLAAVTRVLERTRTAFQHHVRCHMLTRCVLLIVCSLTHHTTPTGAQ